MAEGAAPKSSDARPKWFESRIINAWGKLMKPDKISKLASSEAGEKAFKTFCDTEGKALFVYEQEGELCASERTPTDRKKKMLAFIKGENVAPIAEADLSHKISIVDLHPEILRHLLALSHDIFFPILTQTGNQEGWPDVIAKDLTENFHKFLATTYVVLGHMNGKTLLPLPPDEVYSSMEKNQHDKDSVHVLETSVVAWTHQIKAVLQQDPETALKSGSNPGPQAELDFWAKKAEDLNSIDKQLSDEKVKQIIRVLEVTKSTYFPAFNRLCKEVTQARMEANDNVVYLNAVSSFLQTLATEPFAEVGTVFKPLMHTILLVWKHSKFYNTPGRLVVLMREICNDLIRQAASSVSGDQLFEMEPQDAVDALKTCLKVSVTFKSTYFDYKARVSTECPSNPWRFQNSALFSRLDSFLERCHDVLDLMQTIVQFSKLEKIEVGGTKGKTLTASVQQIYNEFVEASAVFKQAPEDIMNVENKKFDDDFYIFRCQINELERRLAAIIVQAFDDSTTVLGCFKLFDSFEGLLEREIILADLEKKNSDLLNAYAEDLKAVQEIFVMGKDDPPIADNAPPHAGAVTWCRGLVERVEEPMNRLKGVGKAVLESEEGKEIVRAHSAIMASLREFEVMHIDNWCFEQENTGIEKLKQNLLRRDEGEFSFLRVNFDPALVCLLREVKYFLMLKIEVPDSAQKNFAMNETFRQQTGNLDLVSCHTPFKMCFVLIPCVPQIVNIYNNMLATLLDVERPLLQGKLDEIDKVLKRGEKHLNWKSHAINEFVLGTSNVPGAMTRVKEANSILQTIKSNVKETQNVLKSFAEPLMMDRNPTKTYTIDQFQEIFKKTVASRYAVITKGGLAIHEQLSNSSKVLLPKITNGNENWRRYVDYVNQIAVDGLCEVTLASARYLKNQLDETYLTNNDINPLLEIQLKLAPPHAVFTPHMGNTAKKDGLRDMVDSWLSSFVNIATLVNRLDTPEQDGDYLLDMQEDISVKYIVSQIYKTITQNEAKCEDFRQQFMAYSYIWLEDIQQKFAGWKEANSNKNPEALDKDPLLSAFDSQIVKYKALEEEIRELPTIKVIGWVKIDAKPIKSALSTWVSKWTYQYQSYLLEKVTSRVTDLVQFVSFTDSALDTEVSDTDRKAMLDVMGYLRDVRKRTEATDAMFDPLRQTVSLLSKHQVQTPEEVLRQLEEAPLAWNNLKKKAVVTKEKQAKNQSREADKIKKESKDFEAKVEAFVASFKKEMPFEYQASYNEAYRKLDAIHHGPNEIRITCGEGAQLIPMGTLKSMRKEVLNLNELQELFELYVIEYREVAQCEKDATLLKRVWDVISMVQAIYSDWRSTKWDEIKVDTLQEENKKLQKEVKGCDKMVKNWPCYKGLEDAVKNMQTSLPLVEELHHPAMRERHWSQLMRACGVQFKMDDKFTFGDMLKLELHRFEDDVLEIVDRAQKELTIEKQLQKLADTWKNQNLSYPPDPENADLVLLAVEETVMEALEDNQLQLQNLQASKYVQGNADFLEKVQTWQKKLGMVDIVISTWKEVQSKWSNLQSIFIGSADIRVQLPEDSKRFDGVDAEWKELMKEAVNETNAVIACNFEGRQERLDNMSSNLEKCEKSLADYLETKRVAYPRFYFVASADLLDILSKGSNPQLIIKHLTKCFDNIKTLEFNKDSNGVPTKTAIGMYSGENEYVAWPSSFVCEGPVENWLFKLTEHTHESLKALMQDSVTAFDEKPRHEFIFDWCAELVQVVSRIVYTEEVNWSFEQLEEGNENAMRDFNKKQIDILNKYAELILGDLSSNDRRKIIMLMTLDVHARDVVIGLIDSKAETNQTFAWMSQLKFHMDEKTNTVRIEICDYVTYFGYEYIGNCGCLVVTPLTDRCYITLTQAMRLILGGAPAGPAGNFDHQNQLMAHSLTDYFAGTGKTETTKDLGRALGVMVYVFNCSDQMDYKSMGQIFKGLSQAGAWGCFDEFNRIDISVLSVVSTQYKTILDAIRGKKARFIFEEEDIVLNKDPYCCAFITMNPGYAGQILRFSAFIAVS